ncbi:MAG: HEAT repeat domain-containing protein [Bryobacterales bacterium]|nr:HEAT repeat domain-containing protein [Bryobacterales bacterium]
MSANPFSFALVFALLIPALAQTPKDVREVARGGANAIPQLEQYLKNPDLEVRVEAVKQIVEIGTQRSLDPLIQATLDTDPEVQIRATDGLVNFYLPGYVRSGLTASIRRVGSNIRGRFTDTNDQVIDPYIKPRPEVIQALGKLARGGVSMDSRANAARALGVLRGQAAVPDLVEAVRSKNSLVIYESLIAFQKIRDQSVGPRIQFLLRDLDERVQIAALETTGLLQNREAVPDLKGVVERARNNKIRRAALTALAMLPDESSREVYSRYLRDRDEGLRGAAAEGFARLKNKADLPVLEQAFQEERKISPRLSLAFALVMSGKTEMSEFSPLQLLVNSLNSSARGGEAFAFLVEVARDPAVRAQLYPAMERGTKDEKIRLARVMARSGGKDSVAALEILSRDSDSEVAQEGLRALQNLKTRL